MAGGMVLLIPCLQKLRINPHTSPVWPRPASRPLGGLTFSRNMAPGRCHWTPVWTEGQGHTGEVCGLSLCRFDRRARSKGFYQYARRPVPTPRYYQIRGNSQYSMYRPVQTRPPDQQHD